MAVDDTVFQFEDEKETTPNVSTIDELEYPVIVPILTSVVTILIVLIILGAVIRWKCFNHTMGTFCFKEDIQNQDDINVDMYPKNPNNTERYKINFDNERNMTPDDGKRKFIWPDSTTLIYSNFMDGIINDFRFNTPFFLLRLHEIQL